MTTTRNDNHRVSEIRPAEYTWVTSYSLPSASFPIWNMERVRALQSDPAVRFFQHPERASQPGRCDVCGANFVHGDIWKHEDGEHIHMGHDCAGKYELYADRAEWNLEQKRRRAEKAKVTEARLNAEKRAAFLAEHPGLEEALAVDNSFVADVAARFERKPWLSPAQVAAVMKTARRIADAANRPPEQNVPAPEGRVTVRGTVVSVKSRETDWGTQFKMTVKVVTDAGTWLAWGTCPQTLFDAQHAEDNRLRDAWNAEVDSLDLNDLQSELSNGTRTGPGRSDLRGSAVEFTATLKQGRDAHFAIFTRPSKASVTGWGEREAA
ncbi:hypothetical protein LCGC14_0320290 [marine sediment metagenome]|uniref:Uncharacterized protein n=1 Tax=marine sediment metagenome TaxID=412755 RepID=A0A0F9W6X2_9ZZZZ